MHAIESPVLRAAERHAAHGEYAAATALLDALPPGAGSVPVALLRARMLAQQRKFDDAIAQWKTVLAAVPNHGDAKRGIARAERLKRRPGVLMRWRLHASAAAVVAALIAATALVIRPEPPDPALAAVAAIADVAERQRASELQLVREIRAIGERVQAAEANQRESSSAITRDLARTRRQVTTVQRDLRRLRPPPAAR